MAARAAERARYAEAEAEAERTCDVELEWALLNGEPVYLMGGAVVVLPYY